MSRLASPAVHSLSAVSGFGSESVRDTDPQDTMETHNRDQVHSPKNNLYMTSQCAPARNV